MKCVILCGGKGTRIRGVDDRVPKPMIRVGSQPILTHIMSLFAKQGHRDFVLCLGYLGDVIRSHFGAAVNGSNEVNYVLPSSHEVRVTLVDTGIEAMTGARVRAVERFVGNQDFFLTYGDGVSDVRINAVQEFHSSHNAVMTLTAVRPPSRFGEVQVNSAGYAVSFNEKPQVSAGLISGGFFVCSRGVFDYLDDSQNLVLEAEPMRAMVKDGRLAAYVHEGFWQCMDTFRDWELLNTMAESGNAIWLR